MDCRRRYIRARGEDSIFERGERGLAIGLTEWDEPHASSHQVGDVALQESGQREDHRDFLFRAAYAQDHGQSKWYGTVRERLCDFVEKKIGPHLAQG